MSWYNWWDGKEGTAGVKEKNHRSCEDYSFSATIFLTPTGQKWYQIVSFPDPLAFRSVLRSNFEKKSGTWPEDDWKFKRFFSFHFVDKTKLDHTSNMYWKYFPWDNYRNTWAEEDLGKCIFKRFFCDFLIFFLVR